MIVTVDNTTTTQMDEKVNDANTSKSTIVASKSDIRVMDEIIAPN
jgi:hypothetical protein